MTLAIFYPASTQVSEGIAGMVIFAVIIGLIFMVGRQ